MLYLDDTIEHTLACAQNPEDLEFIVVDAGSNDGTLESIKHRNISTFERPDFALKKYESMNFGVGQSSGSVILFLDADTMLPRDFDQSIKRVLPREGVIGGAFEFSFTNPRLSHYLVTIFNRFRYRLSSIFYGDQALYVKKEVLLEVGGVPAESLMETAFLCKNLLKRGKLELIHPGIKTSPRRFEEGGFFKVAWFDINMLIRFNLGLSVAKYAEGYWGKNKNHQ